MDIAAWLREMGLEEYEPAFRDKRMEIGIAAVGDCWKFLEAITSLREVVVPLPAQEQARELPG
jgi:hypothetical protein